MLKSCKYCGRIHDEKYNCEQRPKEEKVQNSIIAFRSSRKWKKKRQQIMERDLYMCQLGAREKCEIVCGRNSKERCRDTLSVHHIISIAKNYEMRLDDDNLITVGSGAHEAAEKGRVSIQYLQEIAEEQCQKDGER